MLAVTLGYRNDYGQKKSCVDIDCKYDCYKSVDINCGISIT